MSTRRVKPVGQATRGKTALNRLRQIDTYIALNWSHVLSGGAPLVVDVGYGAQAWTALEMFERWLPLNAHLRLLGVEIDPERVAAAQIHAQPGCIGFRLGGFNLVDALGADSARVVRACNVLRQYDESAVEQALHSMARALETGGLMIEGTSTPSGRIAVFDVYQQHALLTHRELVFATNFREALEPVHFQAILPKRLIHHTQEEPLAGFFAAWRRANTLARGTGQTGPRQRWINAARLLADRYAVDTRVRLLRRGYLVVREKLWA